MGNGFAENELILVKKLTSEGFLLFFFAGIRGIYFEVAGISMMLFFLEMILEIVLGFFLMGGGGGLIIEKHLL